LYVVACELGNAMFTSFHKNPAKFRRSNLQFI